MGQTDELMMHQTRTSGYMYTPIRRGHKPTPSQESNTLSEASCTTTLSVESGGQSGGHLSPTYQELDEDNRLQDFRDEALSNSRDDIAGGAAPLAGASSAVSLTTPCSNNEGEPNSIVNNIPSDLAANHLHINNNNKSPSCSNFRHPSTGDSGGESGDYEYDITCTASVEQIRKIPSDVMFIDAAAGSTSSFSDSYSERRSTLGSSVGCESTLSSRFRDSCDTVIPVTSSSSNNKHTTVATTNSLPVDESKGGSNSDYGSFCATPTERNSANKTTSSGGSGQPVDGYQNAPLLSDMEDDLSAAGDVSGNGSASSLGGKRRRGGPVKIDLPSSGISSTDEGSSGISSSDIPHEPLKTLLAAFFLATGFVATTTSLAITHEHVPEIAPLPDVILDNVTYTEWGLDVAEILLMISTMSAVLVVMLHSHRLVILRRIWFLLGCLYYYRAITMFITVLPKADPKYTCHPKLDNTTALPAWVIVKRVFILMSGMGLSINGKHIYCGDYIFSGHTMVLTMGYLVIKEYSPRRFFLLHWLSFFTSVIAVIMLLIARGHYSIDCLIGYYITTRLWYIYHTLANTESLKTRGRHNFLDQMWWWLIFRFFEKNIPGPLPRRYSFPLPNPVKRCLRRLYRNWRLRRRSAAAAGSAGLPA
jgi:shingomyelin synthase